MNFFNCLYGDNEGSKNMRRLGVRMEIKPFYYLNKYVSLDNIFFCSRLTKMIHLKKILKPKNVKNIFNILQQNNNNDQFSSISTVSPIPTAGFSPVLKARYWGEGLTVHYLEKFMRSIQFMCVCLSYVSNTAREL